MIDFDFINKQHMMEFEASSRFSASWRPASLEGLNWMLEEWRTQRTVVWMIDDQRTFQDMFTPTSFSFFILSVHQHVLDEYDDSKDIALALRHLATPTCRPELEESKYLDISRAIHPTLWMAKRVVAFKSRFECISNPGSYWRNWSIALVFVP